MENETEQKEGGDHEKINKKSEFITFALLMGCFKNSKFSQNLERLNESFDMYNLL